MVQNISSSCTPMDCLAHTSLWRPWVQLVIEGKQQTLVNIHAMTQWAGILCLWETEVRSDILSYDIGMLSGQLFLDNLALAQCHPWTIWTYETAFSEM